MFLIFSGIPTLDILFRKLLVINPKERMIHEKFYNYVLYKDFLNLDTIYKDKINGKIYVDVKNDMKIREYEKFIKLIEIYNEEGKKEVKELKIQIMI